MEDREKAIKGRRTEGWGLYICKPTQKDSPQGTNCDFARGVVDDSGRETEIETETNMFILCLYGQGGGHRPY